MKVLLTTGLKRCKMKVILVVQIRKTVGMTGQDSFYFAPPESYKLIGMGITSFIAIPYTPTVFLFNFVNSHYSRILFRTIGHNYTKTILD